jgi:hypothetical protein
VTDGSCIKVTGDTDTSGVITDNLTYIKSVYWFQPTNAADLINLIDKEGGPIINMVGDSTGDTNPNSQAWDIGTVFNGVYSDDFDSGTLYIYTR